MPTQHPALPEDDASEHLLAVLTLWGVAGAFGLGLILSGFHDASIELGLLGFGCIIAGFVAHVLVNHEYRTRFSQRQIVAGLSLFCVAVLSFVASWLADPGFGTAGIAIGLGGFAALVLMFLVYIVSMHGVRGAFSMFHRRRRG